MGIRHAGTVVYHVREGPGYTVRGHDFALRSAPPQNGKKQSSSPTRSQNRKVLSRHVHCPSIQRAGSLRAAPLLPHALVRSPFASPYSGASQVHDRKNS